MANKPNKPTKLKARLPRGLADRGPATGRRGHAVDVQPLEGRPGRGREIDPVRGQVALGERMAEIAPMKEPVMSFFCQSGANVDTADINDNWDRTEVTEGVDSVGSGAGH